MGEHPAVLFAVKSACGCAFAINEYKQQSIKTALCFKAVSLETLYRTDRLVEPSNPFLNFCVAATFSKAHTNAHTRQ
jgi:hypothetical protein